MYGRKVKLRFFFIFLILTILSLSIFLILKSLEENVVYFKSPTEIKNLTQIDKKKINQIGGWDNYFYTYLEDIDLCYRVRKNNFEIIKVKNSIVNLKIENILPHHSLNSLSANLFEILLYQTHFLNQIQF